MRKIVDRVLEIVLASLLVMMTLDVLWGVFTRYIIGSQASWSEELARFLLIWIGILGAAYASGQRMHLAIDLYPMSLPPEKRKRLNVFISLLIILFCIVVLVIGGSRLVYVTSTLGQISAALRVPLAFVYSIVPISGLFIIYFKIHDLTQTGSEQ
jgi:TRAP-type C4-dicarboxylate transport system permease small subunit